MTFLGNVVLEAARLEISGGSFRLVMKTHTYKNFVLPKGHLVTVYTPSVHRNPELFPNPDTFDPDRLLTNHHVKDYQHSLMVFGGGPHACLGRRFYFFSPWYYSYSHCLI